MKRLNIFKGGCMITRADRVKDAIRYFSLVTVILGLLLFFSWVGIHGNIYKYI